MNRDPIVIAGAGPCGLVTALGLARHGVPTVVLEAEPSLPQDLRATTFHPPTLDMLAELGVAAPLIALGNVAAEWQFRDRSAGRVAAFDLALIADETRYPYRLQCEQFHLTAVLADALRATGEGRVEFAARVEDVSQTDSAVTIRFRTAEGLGAIRAAYLVAADGGRSAIRKALPIAFEGFTYRERIVQAGTAFDFRTAIPDLADINYISDPEEWCVLLQIAGYWRVSFPLPPEADEEEAVGDAALQRRLQGLVHQTGDYALVHRRCWRIHQRVASDFHHGRIVLAGDAAHVNSPHGGMGMNSAIHDAVNLAGKLAALWKGAAAADVLDLYTRQRRFIALEDVRVQSMRNSQLMSERDAEIRRRRLDDMRRMADDPVRARRFLLESSMIAGLRKSEEIV
ncbi:MAG TPA: FAD-dependent monooxygenase [Stellaceae bacterium]|nr:FAD-dependent monooxygenase [Stellaceae bacterium]